CTPTSPRTSPIRSRWTDSRPSGRGILAARSIGQLGHDLATSFGRHVERAPEGVHDVARPMMPASLHRRPGELAALDVADLAVVETERVEHRVVAVLAVGEVPPLAHPRRELGRVSEIVGVVAV